MTNKYSKFINKVKDLSNVAKGREAIFLDGIRCARIESDGCTTYIACQCFGGDNHCKMFGKNGCKIYTIFALEEKTTELERRIR